jgi:lactoylglutathione lyase
MHITWITIHIRDMERSLQFYTGILGLELVRRFKPQEHMEIAFLGKNGTQIELIADQGIERAEFPEQLSIGFMLDGMSIDEFRQKHGINSYEGPFQPNEHIRFIYIKDPVGVKIQLIETL